MVMINIFCGQLCKVSKKEKAQLCSFVFIGKIYDEKVDIFSFGIVLCEVREPLLPPLKTSKLKLKLSSAMIDGCVDVQQGLTSVHLICLSAVK